MRRRKIRRGYRDGEEMRRSYGERGHRDEEERAEDEKGPHR